MTWPDPTSTLGWIFLGVEVVLRLVALGVIPGNRKPSTGMAWLLLIMVEPIVGFLVFLLFGRTRLGNRRVGRQREAMDAIRERTDRLPMTFDTNRLSAPIARVASLNHRLGALPLTGGNEVQLWDDYPGVILEMAAEVDRARSHVHVEFYITAWDDVTDPLFQSMIRATGRGVDVRLLFDHLGSRGIPGYRQMLRRLRRTDIDWHPMLPIKPLQGRFRRPDLRNHRKILVVDGSVGFTGSLNLTEPCYNKPKNLKLGRAWVELMVRLEGPVVGGLNSIFATDWYVETGEPVELVAVHGAPDVRPDEVLDVPCQVVPSGPGVRAENNLRMFTTLIYAATERVSLTSPYFVPDESLLYAVTTAAERGVDVELFVSEVADQFMVGHAQASYYRELLRAGVRIHRYPAPYVLHAKHFTIDDNVAVIGSSNMDMRSFGLNYEVSLMLPDPAVVARLREVQDGYRALSKELTLSEWDLRPRRTRYVDNVMRLTAALQ
ncbi:MULTISPECIES: cardiolipin synthase [unclassified Nocardioides]|uniref:cardiolipin synthase n=1 Tax=unclassified Nocardioides TaxID=2615069 RepID=UPI000701A52A|nr:MULTISPECIES: cardiolipin synthase [unclassified Nocardioides]KRA37620.1 cardiolipin synthase [Nocardioides sp. Root614]KRA91581.1 cardiolipin synthase [Nocardioides sp. Root682]